jgi:hypothetical protein
MPDAYTRRARIAPVVLAAAPLLPLAITALVQLSAWQKLWAAAWLAVPALVEELGRDQGRRLQPKLWRSWGGAPTTAMLRWRNTSNRVQVERRHELLQQVLGPAPPLPTDTEEAQDPDSADAIYETAIGVLKEHTRDATQFPLVLSENARYGFRRNMLGLRPFGLAGSLLGLVVAIVATASTSASRIAFLTAATIDALLLAFWWRTVTSAWVRRQAEAYAEALLRTIEHLAHPQKPGTSPPRQHPHDEFLR